MNDNKSDFVRFHSLRESEITGHLDVELIKDDYRHLYEDCIDLDLDLLDICDLELVDEFMSCLLYTSPGGENVLRYKKKKPSKHVCAECGKLLHGVPRGRPYEVNKYEYGQERLNAAGIEEYSIDTWYFII